MRSPRASAAAAATATTAAAPAAAGPPAPSAAPTSARPPNVSAPPASAPSANVAQATSDVRNRPRVAARGERLDHREAARRPRAGHPGGEGGDEQDGGQRRADLAGNGIRARTSPGVDTRSRKPRCPSRAKPPTPCESSCARCRQRTAVARTSGPGTWRCPRLLAVRARGRRRSSSGARIGPGYDLEPMEPPAPARLGLRSRQRAAMKKRTRGGSLRDPRQLQRPCYPKPSWPVLQLPVKGSHCLLYARRAPNADTTD